LKLTEVTELSDARYCAYQGGLFENTVQHAFGKYYARRCWLMKATRELLTDNTNVISNSWPMLEPLTQLSASF
jgi:hypothetical protein